jgi:hypothetical protein
MIPGADRVVACPLCADRQRFTTVMSGNTFGTRAWTDGKVETPMLPDPPAVVQCRHCGGCYFLTEAATSNPEVGAADDIPYVVEPSEAAYYEAIASGLARDRIEERLLRIRAWWKSNDPFRDRAAAEGDRIDAANDSARIANISALLTLLSDDDDDLVLKAEIFRELGKWGDADAVLARVTSMRRAPIVDCLRSLCADRNRQVQPAPVGRAARSIVVRL